MGCKKNASQGKNPVDICYLVDYSYITVAAQGYSSIARASSQGKIKSFSTYRKVIFYSTVENNKVDKQETYTLITSG